MALFPAFLKLNGRQIVIIGGGALAASKMSGLLDAGARVRVISPQLNAELGERLRRKEIDWLPKLFSPDDLDGAFLVIAATSLRDVNSSVYQEADRRGILCNAVDDIENCHFYYGSIVQRGDLQIAISTNGKSPALAQRLRKEFEEQFGPEYSAWLEWLGAARELLRSQFCDSTSTKHWLHVLASRSMFEKFMQQSTTSNSKQGVA
jgi:siroheme synthase-like protein